jgi:O-antigen ligase
VSLGSLGPAGLAFVAAAALLVAAAGWLVGNRVGPAWLVAPGIALSVFSGNWGQFGLPIGPDRLLIAGGLAIALWRVLRKDRPEEVRLGAVHVVLALLAAYAACSAVQSGAILRSTDVYLLLDKLGFLPFAVFALAPAIFPTARERRVLFGCLLALAVYLAVTAVGEASGVHALVYPKYILDPNLGLHADRVRGPFLEASGMGLGLFAGLVVVATATARAQGTRRLLLALAGVGLVVGLVATVTRHVWIGSAAGTVLALALVPALRRWIPVAIGGGAALVVAVLLVLPGLQHQASDRAQANRPVWDRLNSDRAALDMWEERPLLGQGWGAYAQRGDDYYQLVDAYPLTHVGAVHNVALAYLSELGGLGAGLWALALCLALLPALRRRARAPGIEPWRIGLIAIAVDWLVTAMFVPLGYAFPNMLLWTWAGIVWAGSRTAPARVREPVAPPVAVPPRIAERELAGSAA